ncbi:MAG: hypothetical protein M0Z87_09410 [Actinomycetota bacterium]|nr:hypothetical protein [Actinomycetota bacterium]
MMLAVTAALASLASPAVAAPAPAASATVPTACNSTAAPFAVVGMAYSSSTGYWLAGSSGSVLSCGSAVWYGQASTAQMHGAASGIATAPGGHGYYVLSRSGGVFDFGISTWHGSPYAALRGHLGSPAVGIATTATGSYVVTAAGNVFDYGGAAWHGSPAAAGVRLAAPIPTVTTSPGGGYWLGASDGGVFSYAAPFYGSGVAAVSCSSSMYTGGPYGPPSAATACPGAAPVGAKVAITVWDCASPPSNGYAVVFLAPGQHRGNGVANTPVPGTGPSAAGTERTVFTIPSHYDTLASTPAYTAPGSGYRFGTSPPNPGCVLPFTVLPPAPPRSTGPTPARCPSATPRRR